MIVDIHVHLEMIKDIDKFVENAKKVGVKKKVRPGDVAFDIFSKQ